MQVLVVEFRIRTEHVLAFELSIDENARTSLAHEPGCRQFDVCRDPADAALFFLYELYDDDAAVQAHLQSAHFLHFNAITQPWVASKLVRRYQRLVP